MKNLLYILLAMANLAVLASEKGACLEQKDFLNGKLGKIYCSTPYHHYNADSSKYYDYQNALSRKIVRIASFNVFQAGSTKTEFKDISVLASIINKWDVVGVVELVSNVGQKKRHNDLIVNAIEAISDNPALSVSERTQRIELLKRQYEQPGYVEILKELRKLNPSWSLLLTPNSEGVARATVKELAGYYYRAKYVKPITNEYCKNYVSKSSSYACYVQFEENFYGKNVSSLMARLPFMASFRSGRFDFSPILTHTIFTPPTSSSLRKKILKAAFGVTSIDQVGDGLTKETYARFAEIKHILEFSKLYQQSFKENDVPIMGDFNLNSGNPYWNKLLSKYSGVKLKVESKTSLARSRYRDDKPTEGLKNDYDHFLINEDETTQCASQAKAYNFLKSSTRTKINQKYLVRGTRGYTQTVNNRELERIYYSKSGREKMKHLKKAYETELKKKYTVVNGQIVKRYPKTSEKVEDMVRKLFTPQTYERTYYRYISETVSDHLPIYIPCRNTYDDD